MSALAQTIALSGAIIVAYLWLSIPALEQYSLQVFALCILLYFILKKINDAHIWELLPTTAVDEMVLTTFAFLILVGGTNGTQSVFFPLMFVYLFFVSMTLRQFAAITITLEVILFFYALAPGSALITNPNINWSHLISLPVVMTFYLFAKYQYEQARANQTLVEIENNEIHSYQIFLQEKENEVQALKADNHQTASTFVSFLQHYLQPKLEQLQNMLEVGTSTAQSTQVTNQPTRPTQPSNTNANQVASQRIINANTIKGQLILLRTQIEKIIQQLRSN